MADRLSSLFLKYRFSPEKKLSQNFLVDQKKIQRFVDFANIKGKKVVEVGPGTGFITAELLKKAKKVFAIEIDPKLCAILKEEFKSEIEKGKLVIKNDDFLSLEKKEIDGYEHLVSSVPYHISSDFMYKLFELDLKDATLILQEDFAQKLESLPFYSPSAISVVTNYYAKLEFGEKIPQTAFVPQPKVGSKMVKLKFRKKREIKNEKLFICFIKEIFRYQNKSLKNAITLTLKNNPEFEWAINKLDLSKHENLKVNELGWKEYVNMFKMANL